jgi:hypothetical protein
MNEKWQSRLGRSIVGRGLVSQGPAQEAIDDWSNLHLLNDYSVKEQLLSPQPVSRENGAKKNYNNPNRIQRIDFPFTAQNKSFCWKKRFKKHPITAKHKKTSTIEPV